MSLTLSLTKDGETAPKLALNLSKNEKFTIELSWDSQHDLDAHALLAFNAGQGAKVTSFDQLLSTYNCKSTNASGTITGNLDGSFSTLNGAATHSGDARTGKQAGVDEMITIDGSRIPATVNEIPIFVTIHPVSSATFDQVKDAKIVIKNSNGDTLADYVLSDEFKGQDAVQMGSIVLENGQWHYSAAASGFKGDFNYILGFFS